MPTKPTAPPAITRPRSEAQRAVLPSSPQTLEDRLRCIEALGQRIEGYVQFMSEVGSLNGTSTEAKERAVAQFYEQLAAAEAQLGRIQEALRLE
jgi:hypothetical protein